jgi:hypothetical protein
MSSKGFVNYALLDFELGLIRAKLDAKGQGKPCGKGFISARKECSEKGRKQLASDLKSGDEGAKKRVARGKELAKSRQELTRQVQADKGKKPRDVAPSKQQKGGSSMKTALPKNKASIYRVDVSDIDGGGSSNAKMGHIVDDIAKHGRVAAPVILYKNGMDFKSASDSSGLNSDLVGAVRDAKKKSPRSAEMASAYIFDTKEDADEAISQRALAKVAGDKLPTLPPDAEFGKVDVSSISSAKKSTLDSKTLQAIAESQLKVGNVLPLVVQQTSLDTFEVVHGHDAFAASQIAKKKDPRAAEMTNAVVIPMRKKAK